MRHSLRGSAGRLRSAAALVLSAVCVLATFLTVDTAFAGQRFDRWSRADQAVLGSMMLSRLPAAPPDPSNAHASRPDAAALGQRLFADTRLSKNGQVSCASCHAPERGFQDGRPLGQGIATGSRRTMPIAGAAHSPWLFWDGRKDSLWSQALGPLEDAAEHGANRTQLAQLIARHYRADFEAVFGTLPAALRDLPPHAGPLGTAQEQAAWAAMSDAQRDAVNRTFANLGKAIAAYERTIVPAESRFDRYVRAVLDGNAAGQQVLSAQEVNGLRLFIGKGQCATCHNGPLLTDQSFHNTGIAPRDATRPDRGRAVGVGKALRDEFNCRGAYSDAPKAACQELEFAATDDPAAEGTFKTPGLRHVAERAPYMHAGQVATLQEVVAHYARSPKAAIGHSELAHAGEGHAQREPIRLSEDEIRDVVAFLGALSYADTPSSMRPKLP